MVLVGEGWRLRIQGNVGSLIGNLVYYFGYWKMGRSFPWSVFKGDPANRLCGVGGPSCTSG